jgi:hypothetical protein
VEEAEDAPPGATFEWWAAVSGDPKKVAGVSLNEDSVILYGDELLESYQRYANSTTQINRAERLYLAARVSKPIQARFGTLQDTGRTSCTQGGNPRGYTGPPTAYGAQIQNPANDKVVTRKDGTKVVRKGPRELFVARPGRVFCSTDYGGMELAGWAYCCLRTTGQSRLAEVLNEGGDPHAELGATLAGISNEEAYRLLAANDKTFKDVHRKTGKHANFSFQGGAGVKRFQGMVWKLAREQLSDERATEIRMAWYTTWPEARAYFRWVQKQLSGPRGNERGSFTHFWSGRLRGGLWYSAMANNPFQGLCADIAKAAGWRIAREMYTGRRYDTGQTSPLAGGRLVNFLHDEPISELLVEHAHEGAYRQAEIQVRTAEEIAPGVKWVCEPALMHRWYKSAVAVFDDNKRLVAWAPKEAA